MADADVQLAPDGSGKLVDTGTVSTGAGTVHRQRNAIGDPTAGAAVAAVVNASPVATSYGLVTRPVSLNWVQQINLNPTPTLPGAGATYTSSAIDLGDLSAAGGAAGYSKFRVAVNADQVGVISLQQSPDNSTWYSTLASQPVAASTPIIYESQIVMRYLRISFTNNGASSDTVLVIRGLLVSI